MVARRRNRETYLGKMLQVSDPGSYQELHVARDPLETKIIASETEVTGAETLLLQQVHQLVTHQLEWLSEL